MGKGDALAYHGLGRSDLLRILVDLLQDPDVEVESHQAKPTYTMGVVIKRYRGGGQADEVRISLPANLLE